MINTEHLQQIASSKEPLTGIEPIDGNLNLGQHSLPLSETVIELSAGHAEQIAKIIHSCLDVYPSEDTMVAARIDRPTALARVDCTVGTDGILAYECEERPAGLGVHHLLSLRHEGRGTSDLLQNHIASTLGAEMVVVRHPDALPNDDTMVLPIVEPRDLNGHAVLARGEPHMFQDEQLYEQLRTRSISTIRTEGDKRYLTAVEQMQGRLVTEADQLPSRGESFVLKPLQGSKSKGVKVYLAPDDKKRFGDHGTVTHSKAQRTVTEVGQSIVEPLKAPIVVEGLGNMALRVMALVSRDDIEVIGGAYVIRPELLVHGASNSITGLIRLEGSK